MIGNANEVIVIIGLISLLFTLVGFSVYLRSDTFIKAKSHTIDIGNAQYIGTREKQDDSFGSYQKPYGVMAVVADGIGGFINGDIASSMTVNTFLKEFKKGDITGNVNYFFQTSAKTANHEIRKKFEDTPCGTTVVSVIVNKRQMYWYSVGDSNIAIYRKQRLIPVNRKQNVENWLEDQYFSGKINREEAMNHPQKRRLMNYIGYDGFEGGETCDKPVILQKNDMVLLYTDGLETLNQIELETILGEKGEVNDIAEKVMEVIKQKNVKSKDNATVVIIKVK